MNLQPETSALGSHLNPNPSVQRETQKRKRGEGDSTAMQTTSRFGQTILDEFGSTAKRQRTALPQNMNQTAAANSNISQASRTITKKQKITANDSDLVALSKILTNLADKQQKNAIIESCDVDLLFASLQELLSDPQQVDSFIHQLQEKAPDEIAYMIFHLGKLAHLATKPIAAESLQCLLDILSQQTNLTSKLASITFIGLNMLIQCKCLAGQLNANTINSHLLRLTQLADLGPLSITKIFSILTDIYVTDFIAGTLDASITNTLLTTLLQFENLTPQDCCTIFFCMDALLHCRAFHNSLDANIYQHFFSKLSEIKPQLLCHTLYELGALAKKHMLIYSIDARIINNLLLKLIQDDEVNPHDIQHIFYGLGLLTKEHKIDGAIDSVIINQLLAKLSNLEIRFSKNISLSLYSLGLMAQSKHLHGKLDAAAINLLLIKQSEIGDLIAQGISNPLYGVGLIAASGLLQGTITACTVKSLLAKLHQLGNMSCQEASNALYGVGFIAEIGCLKGTIEASTITTFLEKYTQLSDLDSQGIGNIIYGVGYIALSKCLKGDISAKIVNTLLSVILNNSFLTAQGLFSCLHGIGNLAAAHCLRGLIHEKLIDTVLCKLPKFGNQGPHGIHNTLFNIGSIAQSGQIDGPVHASRCNDVLKELASKVSVNPIKTSMLFYGLSQIAKSKLLQGTIDAALVNMLLRKCSPQDEYKERTLILYSLGLMAKNKCLYGAIDALAINPLLTLMNQSNDRDQRHIANSMYGLACLKEANQLINEVSREQLSLLWTCIENPSKAASSMQTIFSISCFWPEIRCDTQILKKMFQSILEGKAFIHPSRAITLIKFIATFHDLYDELNPIFESLLFHIIVPFKVFSQNNQKQLLETINALSKVPVWQQALINQLQLDYSLDVQESTSQTLLASSQTSSQANENLLPQHSDQIYYGMPNINSINSPINALVRSSSVDQARQAYTQTIIVEKVPQRPTQAVVARIQTPNKSAVKSNNKRKEAQQSSQSSNYRRAPLNTQNKYPIANGNQIFNLIADGNFAELERALGLKHRLKAVSPIKTTTPKSPSLKIQPPKSQLSSLLIKQISLTKNLAKDSNNTLDEMVVQFFKDVEPQALRDLIKEAEAKFFTTLLRACSFHTRYQLAIADSLSPLILYLELGELKALFNELHAESGLGLYRDHQALLRLTEAINLRMIMHPKEAPTLVHLRSAFCERGIAHHQMHRHVINRLLALQKPQAAVVLDDYEEELETDNSYFNLLQHNSIPLLAIEMDVEDLLPTSLQNETMNSPEIDNFPECLLDINYKYRDDVIQNILAKRIAALNCGAKLLGAANMNEGASNNRVADVIRQFKDHEGVFYFSDHQNVIVPIRYEDHWVGVRLILEEGEVKKVIFYNSLKDNPIYQENLMSTIERELKEADLIPQDLSLTYHKACMQQLDGTSCGAYLIENIYCDLKDVPWLIPPHRYAATFRKRHHDLLKT